MHDGGLYRSRLVFGTDEEKALVNAITTIFPNSNHMLCKRHLYQNAKQKLVDDSVDKADRQEILDLIYGNNGLMTADDSICFDAKSEQIEQVSMKLSGKFLKYFQNKLKSNIKNKLNRPLTSGLVKSPWTNNNSESLNHIFKQSINWKSQPHSNSICTLTSIIETQFRTWESTCKDWSIQTLRNLQTLLSIKDCMDLKIW